MIRFISKIIYIQVIRLLIHLIVSIVSIIYRHKNLISIVVLDTIQETALLFIIIVIPHQEAFNLSKIVKL